MTGYEDLSEFERSVIVGARERLDIASPRVDGRLRVWRQPHESMDPTCLPGTVQAGGGSVIAWGICGWHDMAPLIRLDTTLIDDKYVSILSDHLHPFMSIVHSNGLGEFQKDNATPQHVQNCYRQIYESTLLN
ncbi:transposable element Tcb2 transposase [Trichonephila clavipes]|nr:transposable element Tcb2 transposase [Trichonephila clavipes]